MTKAFQQTVDVSRPHTLLSTNTTHSGSLDYRYDDTQDIVTVPNSWYNQPYQCRVEYVRWLAQLKDDAAAKFQRCPALNMTAPAIEKVVAQYRAQAVHFRAEADRLEAAGVPTHPVAASQIQLNLSKDVAEQGSRHGA